MNYQRVCLESFGYTLPEEVVSSTDLEARLAPAYERLSLPEGRLELMTGIQQRRFYPPGTAPGIVSIASGKRALEAADIAPEQIGALIHGSVCRDHLEPATACSVHHALGLPSDCMIFDVSNACLGILSGVVQVANMIELGQIRAGIVVGTECGRELVDNTVSRLNNDTSLSRQDIKLLVASLTIGSASVAMLLCDSSLSRTGNRLHSATVRADTLHHQLCQSNGLESFMQTDSEQLMAEGVASGVKTFETFLQDTGWKRNDIDKTVCHQVGVAHRKLLFDALSLPTDLDYATLEWLGNTGAAALPITMALAAETGHLKTNDKIALLGIGSGINCQMLGVDWQQSRVCGNRKETATEQLTGAG